MGKHAAQRVFDAIDPDKDVDGFHPDNVGRLVQGRPHLVPCTPSGVIEMLEHYGIPIARSRAVVIGRSEIVGKPMAMLLLARRHGDHLSLEDAGSSRRRPRSGHPGRGNRASRVRHADVCEARRDGHRRRYQSGDGSRDSTGAFRCGLNRLADFERRGSVVVGDVHRRSPDAGALTPVPGGVGPLTIAVLLRNTVKAAVARTVAV